MRTDSAAIRNATRSDFAAIVSVELSAGELFAGTHMAWAVGQHSGEAQLEAARAAGMLWVAESAGRVAGYLMAEVLDGCFYVDEVAVHQRAQRRGVGRLLIEHALAEASARGFRQATLTTDRTLSWNAPYYARLGFRRLAKGKIPSELAARLAMQPNAHLRCAMVRDI